MPPEPMGPEQPEKDPGGESRTAPTLEMADVLFMDIVGYSLLSMERQTERLRKLQDQVTQTVGYQRASAANHLISLPTGDGMALVFFGGDPLAAVECAVDLAKALRNQPEIPLRIGIHHGPVYHVADINANRNVSGGGINMAQRVMDCGDAGHILLSRAVADTLSHLQQWAPRLIDLGEQEVKHGVRIQIYNLCTDEAGNREVPHKVAAAPKPRTLTIYPEKQKKLAVVAAVVGIAVAGASGWFFTHRAPPAQPSAASATGAATAAMTTKSASPADRSFSYSIQVQRYRDGKPYKEPFVLPGEMIFEKDYRIRLQITSAQSGYLYILNQGPATLPGTWSYNILYPGSGEPAKIDPTQVVKIPADDKDWIVFDEQEGVEQLWLVWSAEASPIFESAKAFGDARHQGAIADANLVGQIQQFLEERGSGSNTVRDDGNQRTVVSGGGNVIVKLLKLEHH